MTKIIVKHGEIFIYNSDSIIDKKTHYNITFDSFYKGYVDYYVSKNSFGKPLEYQLSTYMYISTNKFIENKDYWINMAVENYRKRFKNYYWYKEPMTK